MARPVHLPVAVASCGGRCSLDAIYILIVIAFFGAAIAYARACERL
jgi:hypothetical protein